MPELPDIVDYLEALRPRIVGQRLDRARIANPFFVRSVDPPLPHAEGREVTGVRRLGKRLVIELSGDLFLVIHLMIAGRLRWVDRGVPIPKKLGLAALDFSSGTLIVTEAGRTRRASLYLVSGPEALQAHDRGGLEPLDATLDDFRAALMRESHTVKRALTDPQMFSGIGNAYSDEILHRARLSPLKLTRRLTDGEVAALHAATQETLRDWIARLRRQTGTGFPEKVTAFREGMAVHGRFRQPCPACGTPVQRIVYAANECNYCPACQTGGRVLADRALSRLLR